jgi:hypothetical protein
MPTKKDAKTDEQPPAAPEQAAGYEDVSGGETTPQSGAGSAAEGEAEAGAEKDD